MRLAGPCLAWNPPSCLRAAAACLSCGVPTTTTGAPRLPQAAGGGGAQEPAAPQGVRVQPRRDGHRHPLPPHLQVGTDTHPPSRHPTPAASPPSDPPLLLASFLAGRRTPRSCSTETASARWSSAPASSTTTSCMCVPPANQARTDSCCTHTMPTEGGRSQPHHVTAGQCLCWLAPGPLVVVLPLWLLPADALICARLCIRRSARRSRRRTRR